MAGVQRYVSKELSHFVGRGLNSPDERFALLLSILRAGCLTHPPHSLNVSGNLTINPSASLSSNEMYTPQVICFCDIPVEDLHIHTAKYSAFGLSFAKQFIAGKGGAPVLYVPLGGKLREPRNLSSGELASIDASQWPAALLHDVPMSERFDQMVLEFHRMMQLFGDMIMNRAAVPGVPYDYNRLHQLLLFLEFRIFSYIKFFDETLDDDNPKNFYMEREWRLVGNLQFGLGQVERVMIPQAYAERFRRELPSFYGQLTFI